MDPEYIPCPGCEGKGFIMGPIDEPTGDRILKDHERCNGTGILIRRHPRKGRPFYGAPQLSFRYGGGKWYSTTSSS